MTPPSITYTYNGKSLMNSVLAQAEPLRKPDAPGIGYVGPPGLKRATSKANGEATFDASPLGRVKLSDA